MKSKKNIAIALSLALTTVCAVGAGTAFAADMNAQAAAKPAVVASAQETYSKTKDISAKKDKTTKKDMSAKKSSFDKGSITFVGIDAVAAEVLGVSKESLSELNYASQLYAELTEAGKVDEFKTALIAAKKTQYDAKAELGKFSAEELEAKLSGYTQVINDWDGTTELIVSSATWKNKFK